MITIEAGTTETTPTVVGITVIEVDTTTKEVVTIRIGEIKAQLTAWEMEKLYKGLAHHRSRITKHKILETRPIKHDNQPAHLSHLPEMRVAVKLKEETEDIDVKKEEWSFEKIKI